jgi:hypothetical protein
MIRDVTGALKRENEAAQRDKRVGTLPNRHRRLMNLDIAC